jgi:hypothetical protein
MGFARAQPILRAAFLDPEYAPISGIICDSARVGAWHQQGNQRFVSVNNPTTTAVLPPGFFKLGTEYRSEQNGGGYTLTRKEHEIKGTPGGGTGTSNASGSDATKKLNSAPKLSGSGGVLR